MDALLNNLLNTAPYFEKKPEDQTFTLKNATNNFEYALPKIKDDNGDKILLKFDKLPNNVVYDSEKNMLLFNDITQDGEIIIKVQLADEKDMLSDKYEIKFTIEKDKT